MIELLVFSSNSCTPCKKLKALLNKNLIDFTEIDVDIEPELTYTYNISALPTLVLVKDGEILKKEVGLISKAALDEFLKV